MFHVLSLTNSKDFIPVLHVLSLKYSKETNCFAQCFITQTFQGTSFQCSMFYHSRIPRNLIPVLYVLSLKYSNETHSSSPCFITQAFQATSFQCCILHHSRIHRNLIPVLHVLSLKYSKETTLRVQKYGNDGLKHGGTDVLWPMSLVTKGIFSLQPRPQLKLLRQENIRHFAFCLSN